MPDRRSRSRNTFGRDYLHHDIFAIAAAYLYHLVQNHPFVDGNKRVGLLGVLVFLDLNGSSLTMADDRLYELTLAVASGTAGKAEIAGLVRLLAGSKAR